MCRSGAIHGHTALLRRWINVILTLFQRRNNAVCPCGLRSEVFGIRDQQTDVGLMLGQRRGRWPNSKSALDERSVFAEECLRGVITLVRPSSLGVMLIWPWFVLDV